jgi:TonB family protein
VKKSLDTVNGLDDAAIAAARQWRFEPARLSGQPVAVEVTLILEFRQHRDWPRDPRIFPPGPQSDASFLAGTVAAGAAGVVAPVLERGVDPVPSQAARQLGYKGAVRIEAVVDATGRVARVRLVGSGHPLLVDAALVAAFEHVFRPGQAKGVAVPMVVVLELEFR